MNLVLCPRWYMSLRYLCCVCVCVVVGQMNEVLLGVVDVARPNDSAIEYMYAVMVR